MAIRSFGSPNDPMSMAVQARNYQAEQQARGQIGAAQASAAGQVGAAQQSALGNLYSQPANAYGALAGANASGFGAYASGLGQLGNATGGLYNGYNQALSNAFSNQFGAMGQAEAARQVALANVGASALSAGGQAAAGAMGAWGQNQNAWAQAMAATNAAQQNAMSQYGVGRDSALASLGNSAANFGSSLSNSLVNAQQNANNYSRDLNKLGVARDLGVGQLGVSSQVAGNLPSALTGLGGAVNLSANGSPIASGGYGGDSPAVYPTSPAPSLPAYGWRPTQYTSQPGDPAWAGLGGAANATYGHLNDAQSTLKNSSVLDQLASQAASQSRQLDRSYNQSQSMPSYLLNQSMSGFGGLLKDSTRNLNAGMNQFYGNVNKDFVTPMRSALDAGGAALSGLGNQMSSGFGQFMGANQGGYGQFASGLQDMMNRTGVLTDLQKQAQQYAMQDATTARSKQMRDRMAAATPARNYYDPIANLRQSGFRV